MQLSSTSHAFRESRSESSVENILISEVGCLLIGPLRRHATTDSLWISSLQQHSKCLVYKSTPLNILTGMIARDYMNFTTRAAYRSTIGCARRQSVYVEKRGTIPPMFDQTLFLSYFEFST